MEDSRNVLRKVLHEIKQIRPFQIEAWVLLPDHIHTIWKLPDDDRDYSMRWGWIKKEFTKRFRKTGLGQGYSGPLWQKRFWEHMIRDERDFRIHCDYIHYNPVKHGIVESPAGWRYSTFHRYVREGMYEAGWGESEIKFSGKIGNE